MNLTKFKKSKKTVDRLNLVYRVNEYANSFKTMNFN